MDHVVRMCDLSFDPKLFESFSCGTALDELLSSHCGLPRGVNYMIIGAPSVGKTTIILDMLANMQNHYPKARYPKARILFISAEMNEIDLTVYVERYPKFQTLPILIIKDEENIRMKDAESWLLQLIKKQNKAQNDRHLNCTFLTIQQVTKSGNFVGSNRLKHSITAMMELRLENLKNIYSDRYITFSKHRRGDVGVKLFYSLSSTGDVSFDEQRFRQDQRIKHMQSEVAGQIRDFADQFDKLFTPE